MKTILFYFACSILITSGYKGNIAYSAEVTLPFKHKMSAYNNQNDTLLNNIQQKIINAFVQGKISQSDKSLAILEQELLKQINETMNSVVTYWYSYACYYHSILFMIKKENKLSEKILNEGIEQLNKLTHKNSEHFALLAFMESFSIQYAADIEAPSISNRVVQNAENALKLDSANLRAYYVLGSNDFYNPEQYGGGKKAEGYLLKAIRLKDQSISNPYLPSWGKNSAYEMLIRLYIRHKQFNEAKKYYQEAITLFPGDYMINELANELMNH